MGGATVFREENTITAAAKTWGELRQYYENDLNLTLKEGVINYKDNGTYGIAMRFTK